MVEDVGSLPGPRKPKMMNSAARLDRPKPTKRRDNDGPPRRTRIVVLLNSKPRDYRPGSGPPLQRARLLPPEDSTAYIVDRILLPSPGLTSNGKPMPKRMTYIIGWHDLPAARLLVPAMRILDYVSPYVLEEWEWKLEEELEEERAKLKEESKIEELKEKNMPAKGRKGTRKKKKMKPPAHSQIEAAAVVNQETEAQAAAGPAKGVMSLSTPQKARLEEFEGLSEEDSSPSRQVQEELLASQSKEKRQTIVSPRTTIQPSVEEVPHAQIVSPAPQPTLSNGFPATQRKTPLPSLRPDPPVHNYAFPLSFTPIGYGHQAPSVSSSPFDTSGAPFPDTPTEKPKKRRKKEKPQAPQERPEEDGEPAWEVQRLEDMEWFDVEGRGLVRYFKVRWEGDWPPDQNPSWEPEENIPETLVRNYLKNPRRSAKKARQARPAAKRKRETLPWAPERKYSSVSEAFAAGDDGDDAMDLVSGHHYSSYDHNGDDNDRDELFVVEEEVDHGRRGASRTVNRAFGSMESGLFSAYLG